MSAAGPPAGVEDRVATASRLVDRLTAEGFALDDIYVDACVLPLSTGARARQGTRGSPRPDYGRAIPACTPAPD